MLFLSFDVADLYAHTDLMTLIASRKLEMRVDPESFELANLDRAHAKCETNHSDGRIVVRVTADPAAWPTTLFNNKDVDATTRLRA